MKRETRLRQSCLFFTAAALLCLAVLGASALSSRTSTNGKISLQQGKGLEIGQNKTRHLQVVSVEQTEDEILLSLKNDYSKSINAFTVSIGELTISEDYVYSGKGTAPGSQYTFRIAKQPAAPNRYEQPTINILAVVFDDRTGDGESRHVSKILDSRLGDKMQLRRILPLLRKTLSSPDDDLPNALDELVSQVSILPEPSDGQFSSETQNAFRGRKEFVLKIIREIKDNALSDTHASLRNQLAELEKQYEAIIARL